ncbi:MAG: ATP-binding protein [Rubrobacteraceae bacterium]|nr:ATP-binding protein [Rubrobacter sp.]
MSEGPYRDLGSGFARLTGVEGSRRGPSRINSVEDALRELVRNARDAGARNVYVASVLKGRRFRNLTVLDDGRGIPETHRNLVFEPGVTTRHLAPVSDSGSTPHGAPHGAGLSLYHIRRVALEADVVSAASPTAIRVVLDTRILPERTLQSGSRPSRSNLHATLRAFLEQTPPGANPPINVYLASPARILATILYNHIIHPDWVRDGSEGVVGFAREVGLMVSSRTVLRVVNGEVSPVAAVSREAEEDVAGKETVGGGGNPGAPSLSLGPEELREISAILSRSAGASYLGIGELEVRSRAGEIVLKARVFEPEEEYE